MCYLSFIDSSPIFTSFFVFIRFNNSSPFHHEIIMQASSNAGSNIDLEIDTESDIEDDKDIEQFFAAKIAAFAAL